MIKLAITEQLETLVDQLESDNFIAILNLPDANLCNKRGEKVLGSDGTLEQACKGCVTQDFEYDRIRLPIDEVKKIIDYFAANYGTRIITVNGRGDPFHQSLKAATLEKISYAATKGMTAYIFTAGNNLDDEIIKTLVKANACVMISLFGNKFIDADFFTGKKYAHSEKPLQNQAEIAENLRKLITAFGVAGKLTTNDQQITNIGLNYVISEDDLKDDGIKIKALKKTATEAGLFLICNINFDKHPDQEIQADIEALANSINDRAHSTVVNGHCQMGAGSSVTVDYNGELYRCPYLSGKGQGRIQNMTTEELDSVIKAYLNDKRYTCVIRKTLSLSNAYY